MRVPAGRAGVGARTAKVSVAHTTSDTSGSRFTPLQPARICDTRGAGRDGVQPNQCDGSSAVARPIGPGGSITVQVLGLGGVPATGPSAVVLNLTEAESTQSSFLTVWPAGAARPDSSSLNFQSGVAAANSLTVPVGSSGSVSVYNANGLTGVAIDVSGYFEGGSGPEGAYTPVPPSRIADTRPGSGEPYSGRPIGPGGTLQLNVAGAGGVPSSGVSGAVLNITEADATAGSYLAAFPAGDPLPATSTLNFGPSSGPVAGQALVKLGTGGDISIYNSQGRVDVVVDVVGWFSDSTGSSQGGDLFVPVEPTRLVDTRGPAEDADGPTGQELPIGPGQSRDFMLGDTWADGQQLVPSNAQAVSANVTVVDDGPVLCRWYAELATGGVPYAPGTQQLCQPQAGASGYASVYPAGQEHPPTSTLNWPAGANVANAALVELSSGRVSVYNGSPSGLAHFAIDVSGYFVPTGSLPQWSSNSPVAAAVTATSQSPLAAGTQATVSIHVSGSAWGYASVSDVTHPSAPTVLPGCSYVQIVNGSGACSAAFVTQGSRQIEASFEPVFPGQPMPVLSWGVAPASSSAVSTEVSGLSPSTPVYPHDFPDPTLLRVGSTYYAYATNISDAFAVTQNIPVMESTDLQHWTLEEDALPNLPAWGVSFFTWAPTVLQQSSGTYVMFYTELDDYLDEFCLDRATATSPLGPFVTDPLPFLCTQDGVIDPSLFTSPSGQVYLLFKDNALATIYSMPMNPTLTAPTEFPSLLATPALPWERGIIEGPDMVLANGSYQLFFAGDAYSSPGYAVGHAVCSSPSGPCTQDLAPVLSQNPYAQGPGGPAVFSDATGRLYLAYAAWTSGLVGYPAGQRELFIQPLTFSSNTPSIGIAQSP